MLLSHDSRGTDAGGQGIHPELHPLRGVLACYHCGGRPCNHAVLRNKRRVQSCAANKELSLGVIYIWALAKCAQFHYLIDDDGIHYGFAAQKAGLFHPLTLAQMSQTEHSYRRCDETANQAVRHIDIDLVERWVRTDPLRHGFVISLNRSSSGPRHRQHPFQVVPAQISWGDGDMSPVVEDVEGYLL